MAEVTYRSPGFFESEIDLSITSAPINTATPAGVIGPSPIGPAFVPVTVSSLPEFRDRFFGTADERNNSYYAAQEFFRNGQALTFVRTLGAGANSTIADITRTRGQGTVKGAGFVISSSLADGPATDTRHRGSVQFLVASHSIQPSIATSYPVLFDNDSMSPNAARFVRGVLLFPTGTRGMILDYNQEFSLSNVADDVASIDPTSTSESYKTFKLVISSSAAGFGSTAGFAGIKVYTASLDPGNQNYISKVLNTSPDLFQEKQHLLYLDFPIEDDIATVSVATNGVAILSGSNNTSSTSGNTSLKFRDAFGRFDMRYTAPRTTAYISQPFGGREYDLFYFETIADGASANDQFKVSIANLRRSIDDSNSYGTFDVLVRDFYDSDFSPTILEQYVNCNLNPDSPDYVAIKIGDRKRTFNFDTTNALDRRIATSGRRPNVSSRVRIVMNQDVENKIVPATALPFGFRGLPALKFNDGITDNELPASSKRLAGIISSGQALSLTSSIVPPVPYRFKVTQYATPASPTFTGEAGPTEAVSSQLYWGVKFDSMPSASGSLGTSAYYQSNANVGAAGGAGINPLITSYIKFAGIGKLDTLLTGSNQDKVNNNKFSLARVALYNAKSGRSVLAAAVNDLTGTLEQHMINAVYIRDGIPVTSDGTITYGSITDRLTFGSMALIASASIFNRFSPYMKFTNVFYGGFDGLNILDKDMREMNDKSTSTESGGKAVSNPNVGLDVTSNNFAGGVANALISAYRTATDVITDAGVSRANIITIPGIREPLITNYVAAATKNYARAIYLMDIPTYTDTGARIFSTSDMPDVTTTISRFSSRNVNNSYVATYFPDAAIVDTTSASGTKRVRIPASAIALGALAQNDAKSYPWYAPAGFNRTSLSNVTNLAVRITSSDRDSLYDTRINPITSFPGLGFVIFGQKTLQIAKTALDRVNVRRLLIELARIVTAIGLQFVFEPNTPGTRARFVSLLSPQFATVQSQSGIDRFDIVMNDTNNTQSDIEANRLNGRIIIVPTKAVEYIAIDFIITNEGVEFV